jgi:glutaredoxin
MRRQLLALTTLAARALQPPRARARHLRRFSVSGTIYEGKGPTVELFTKEGCTLCDDATAVLDALRNDAPHSLIAVDITDQDKKQLWDRYKYDIPVLAIDGVYWTKHRVTEMDARAALAEAASGKFRERPGEPDASRLER